MHPTQRRSRAIAVRALVAAGLIGVGGGAGAAWRRLGPRRVVVEGESMAPCLRPGDRLLVRRTRGRPVDRFVAGDIVAFHDPRPGEGRILVKRVRVVTASGLDVRGDNPAASTDSRSFGPVRLRAVIGRVTYRYAPPGRVGPLAPR
jgi:nickel-type superoxide dismutase maturation protease